MRSNEKFISSVLELCALSGVTGSENGAADAALRELSQYMPAHIDTLGNVIGEQQGNGSGILLDAHIDQIGMIVTAVDSNGFVKFSRCGGVDTRVFAANEVTIHGTRPVFGVVVSTPPHLAKGESKVLQCEEMSIDTGLCGDAAKEIIHVGDRITLSVKQRRLLGGVIASPALDDRAGVSAILRCLEILKEKNCHCKLSVVFSVQEETSGAGATTGAYTCDAKRAIAVDVSFARAPGIPDEKAAVLGGGTLVGVSPSLDADMSNELIGIAKKNNIPYAVEVMGGSTGTNAETFSVSRQGKKAGLLSIPQRNMHTGVELCDAADIESTAQLLAQYILERGEEDA